VAQFSKHRWPADGPVRTLLEYLDCLHQEAGQPSMAEIGRRVRLAPSTLSAFFTGARLIRRDHLARLMECLGGDVTHAELLRRKAATAWNAERVGLGGPLAHHQGREGDAYPVPPLDGTTRLEIIVFDAPTNHLHRPERLVGRDELIHSVRELLERGERVLLYGFGGTGKTAIAATVADALVETGLPRYMWIRLGVCEVDDAVDEMVRQLASQADREEIQAAAGDARLALLGRVLIRRGIGLCVVDDVWSPAALHEILRAIPDGLGVLATSRLKLGLPHTVEVADLQPADAAHLLALHAHDDAYAWHPDTDALCRDLGYHPYAIEIAGHHLRQYGATPAELQAEIAMAPDQLTMPSGFAATGRESVRRLLDHSLRALADRPDVGRVLSAFGALASGRASTELLSECTECDSARTRAALHGLVDASLARRVAGTSSYEIHDLTWSYARTLTTAVPGGDPDMIDAVLRYLKANTQTYNVIELDLDNVLAAASRARVADPMKFVPIVEALAVGGYLDDRGHTMPLLRLLDDAIAEVRGWGPAHHERLHLLITKRGNAHFNRGELTEAARRYREALELAPTAHRRTVLLAVLGKVVAEMGRPDEADSLFAEAYQVAENHHDDQARLRVLEQHSVAAFRREDYALVRELTLNGRALCQRIGRPDLEAIFVNNLGTAEFRLGIHMAMRLHTEALELATGRSDEDVMALAHRTLGADYHALESFDQAQHHYREAIRLYEKLGQIEREARLRNVLRPFGYVD
jgi:tetratricopeptide (TPR) repeat protein